MTEESIRVRVQFINDIDPFTATAYKYEPMNPLVYSFLLHRPIVDQLQEIIRLLKAPHRVTTSDNNNKLWKNLSLWKEILLIYWNIYKNSEGRLRSPGALLGGAWLVPGLRLVPLRTARRTPDSPVWLVSWPKCNKLFAFTRDKNHFKIKT